MIGATYSSDVVAPTGPSQSWWKDNYVAPCDTRGCLKSGTYRLSLRYEITTAKGKVYTDYPVTLTIN